LSREVKAMAMTRMVAYLTVADLTRQGSLPRAAQQRTVGQAINRLFCPHAHAVARGTMQAERVWCVYRDEAQRCRFGNGAACLLCDTGDEAWAAIQQSVRLESVE